MAKMGGSTGKPLLGDIPIVKRSVRRLGKSVGRIKVAALKERKKEQPSPWRVVLYCLGTLNAYLWFSFILERLG